MTQIKTVFLDRDGVINQDSPDYIKNRDELIFYPTSLEAIRQIKENGMETMVITNQSVINRKMVTPEGLEKIFHKLKSESEKAGGFIKDIFFCPHIPEDQCSCRKPKPGLILAAKEKHGLDLASACMVGDSAKDIECARSAGCAFAVLVRTGNGPKAEQVLADKNVTPDYIADDLYDAVDWIIQQNNAL